MRHFSADSTILPAGTVLPTNGFVLDDERARHILRAVVKTTARPEVVLPLRILLEKGYVGTRAHRAGVLAIMGAVSYARSYRIPVALWFDLFPGHAWAGILGDELGKDRWETLILAIRSLDPECEMSPHDEDVLNDIVERLADPPPVDALPELLCHSSRDVREWVLKLVEVAE